MSANLDPDLLALLACPYCPDRPPLRLDGERLICDQCRGAYPILQGIPHLLVENRIPLDEHAEH